MLGGSWRDIFRNPKYRKNLLLLMVLWPIASFSYYMVNYEI